MVKLCWKQVLLASFFFSSEQNKQTNLCHKTTKLNLFNTSGWKRSTLLPVAVIVRLVYRGWETTVRWEGWLGWHQQLQGTLLLLEDIQDSANRNTTIRRSVLSGCNRLKEAQWTTHLTSHVRYIRDTTHTMTSPNKILYIVCAAESVKVNPMVYMKWLL